MAITIDSFQGEYRFLSNFYPVEIVYGPEGWLWPTVEHAYQAAKTTVPAEREEIRLCPRPGGAKRLGQDVLLRRGWYKAKREIMLDLLQLKFQIPHLHLQGLLLDTGDANLVEGNNWGDTYWGVCNGGGENWLGVLLMLVRGEIRGDW